MHARVLSTGDRGEMRAHMARAKAGNAPLVPANDPERAIGEGNRQPSWPSLAQTAPDLHVLVKQSHALFHLGSAEMRLTIAKYYGATF